MRTFSRKPDTRHTHSTRPDSRSRGAGTAAHSLPAVVVTWSRGLLGVRGFRLVRWLLVEAKDIPGWVGEPGRYLGCVRADGLHDLAAMGDDGIEDGGDIVDHDVDQQAWLR